MGLSLCRRASDDALATQRDCSGSPAAGDDLDDRIATLQALRTRLTTCIGCGCLSIDACDLLNPEDEAGRAGPGAHYLRRDSRRRRS